MFWFLRESLERPEKCDRGFASRLGSTFQLLGSRVFQALALTLLLALPAGTRSQNPRTTPLFGVPSSKPNQPASVMWNEASGDENEKQLQMLNAARQKSLVNDTEKLLKLAHQLDAEIAATNSGSLTEAQLNKIAKIEKLAHSVKVAMSTSVRANPGYHDNFPPIER